MTNEIEPEEGWMAELSAEGRRVVDAATWRQGRDDLGGLVSAWVDSVKSIVSGQNEDYYDDYYIYLLWRDGIREVVTALSDHDASIVLNAVAAADNLFKDNTFDDGGKAMYRMSFRIRTGQDEWYWRRVPLRGPITRSLGIVER